MSVTYYIASYAPEELSNSNYSFTVAIGAFTVDTYLFRKETILKWPTIIIEQLESGNYIFEWTLPETIVGWGGLQGKLSRNLQIISVGRGLKEPTIDFIFWYRDFVSDDQPLFLFSSISEQSLYLSKGIEENEIIKFMEFIVRLRG